MIKVSGNSKSEKGQALKWVLDETARQSGYNVFQVAWIMTFFFENVARALCKGWIVRITGFGIFGPYTWWIRDKNGVLQKHLPSYCYPRFYACRGLLNEVALSAMPNPDTTRMLLMYHNNHRPTKKGYGQWRNAESVRVFTAQKRERSHIMAQAKRLGIEVFQHAV